MSSFTKLSPMASYYVRRLIQSQKDAILTAASDPALAAVLQLEPETILGRLALSGPEQSQRLNNLEILARAYQSLVADGQHAGEANEIEKQILATLGLPNGGPTAQMPLDLDLSARRSLTIGRATEILQGVLDNGITYLGPRIAKDYFITTQPASMPPRDFILEGDHLKTTRPNTDILLRPDLEDLQLWVKTYIQKCSSIIHGFHKFVDKKSLEDLSLLSWTP